MRNFAIVSALALVPFAALAQTTDYTQLIGENQGAAEQFARSNPAESPAAYGDITVVVGDVIPDEVVLQPIPDNELVYARVNEMQVIVNPYDRTIVSVLEVDQDS